MTGLSDSFQRPINYLRISITDRCNLRCIYCMPPGGVDRLRHDQILSYEEINLIARAAAGLGINKLRITGGEPLVRLGLDRLVRMLSAVEGIDDIALTTNGILLSKYAAGLKQAGLKRVNISLDTLKPDKFRQITRGRHELDEVLAGIKAARAAGLNPVKINVVIMAGVNDGEILDLAARTINEDWHVRFIEFMPFVSPEFTASRFLPAGEVKSQIETLGRLEPYLPDMGNGPARYFRLSGARGTIGFITPISEHFCFRCNRLRLTADGKLRACLLAPDEIDLKAPLSSGVGVNGIKELIKKAVASKPPQHKLSLGQVPRDRPFCQVGG